MTSRGRTNQLLYQAELLLDLPAGEDEHVPARRLAAEEGALAMLELALESLLREVTEHARLAHHDWRALLGAGGAPVAELQRLRELSARQDSWLAWLVARLADLHAPEGAARRTAIDARLIVGGPAALGDELRWCVNGFKQELATLRQSSEEW